MNLHKPEAWVFRPQEHLKSETAEVYLGIGAHPDDVEFMVWQGILQCYRQPQRAFASVVITSGQGSSRIGDYSQVSDEQMVLIRAQEQRWAAELGDYVFSASLGYTSQELRQSARQQVVEDIKEIVRTLRPQVIYTHNLADRHDTHVAAVLRVVQALRELGEEYWPREFYGCEVWRSLDWLTGSDRRVAEVGAHQNLMRALMGLYDSQIAGGKGYDLANVGRRQANATYSDAYHPDDMSLAELSMDLLPLLQEEGLTPEAYFARLNSHFAQDVTERLRQQEG